MRRILFGLLMTFALLLGSGTVAGAATLTVVVVGEGTTVPAAGEHTYDNGTVVDLAALTVAGSGYAFSDWSGDVVATSPLTSLTLDADAVVTATFVTPGDYTLTLSTDGAGAGAATLVPGLGVHSYLAGQTATITADPGAAYFGGWTGTFTSTYPTLQVVMNEDKVLNANFLTFGRTVTLSAEAGGTTLPAPGTYRYKLDLYMEIQAISTVPGKKFKQWTGDIEPNLIVLPKVSFPADADRNIVAEFEDDDKDWTLFINVVGAGRTSPAASFLRFADGETAAVSAIGIAGSNHAFAGWSGDVETTEELASLVMDGDKTITATFVSPPEVTLGISVVGPGTTSPAPGIQGYLAGRTARLTAIPNNGKFFAGWSGDVLSILPVLELEMPVSRLITANFGDTGHTLTVQQFGEGSLGIPVGAYGIAEGVQVGLEAVPAPGNRFVKWTGDLGGADPLSASLVVTMDATRTVRALFVPDNSFYVRVNIVGQGAALPSAGDHVYAANTNVYFAALPKSLYVFKEWTGDVSGQQANLAQFYYRVTRDADITVHFAQGETTLTLLQEGQGLVDPTPGSYSYLNTAVATLTATNIPGSLFAFSHWTGDVGVADPLSPNLSLSMLTNRTVTAVFVAQGEGEIVFQSCDQDLDGVVGLSELLRVVQFYNAGGLRCADAPGDSEDGYVAGPIGATTCAAHTTDRDPQDWAISLSELLRVIQFYNALGYYYCPDSGTEDGFCPGVVE